MGTGSGANESLSIGWRNGYTVSNKLVRAPDPEPIVD